ncbi:ATP-binding cassette domain-containing protein [Flavobacterium cerinum]|uniref:ATP-binding cassette domain-containing protein n=1 Tax=Flavobacterium cerinum TaxID=2502784 RepID=A0ABY5IVA9_9FLAO|nr:ATP-binding cassette domain-containing protein [Flavobacterium cerinum]UUC45396.1 ATP-binding cassette domain-containing protein [Flavobacterium cerinum]
MNYCLEADSIIKSYGDDPLLTDIYLKCETNDIIGILGRNGTGKSTLLKILFGTMEAENKSIRINNTVYETPYQQKNLFAFLPQNHFIPGYFSVEKAISLFLPSAIGISLYEDSVIRSIRSKKIRDLSAGELRYLEVKLVLHLESHFVLLDEPYSSLSPLLTDDINRQIEEKTAQKGFIITDHHYESIFKIATKIYLLKNGQAYPIRNKLELVEMGYLKSNML